LYLEYDEDMGNLRKEVTLLLIAISITLSAGIINPLQLTTLPTSTTQQSTNLYISAYPDSFLIKGNIFHYTVVLVNPYDTAVSSYLPYVTVTLTYGNDVVYKIDIAFNMTGSIMLGPHEERTIYDSFVKLKRNVQKGSYWLQAEGGWIWAPAEGLPTEKIVFITLPTLITL